MLQDRISAFVFLDHADNWDYVLSRSSYTTEGILHCSSTVRKIIGIFALSFSSSCLFTIHGVSLALNIHSRPPFSERFLTLRLAFFYSLLTRANAGSLGVLSMSACVESSGVGHGLDRTSPSSD